MWATLFGVLKTGVISMTTQLALGRIRAAALALCSVAAITACAAPAPGATAGPRQPATLTATISVPIVVGCGQAQVRPGDYNLTCTAGAYLAGLQWASWGSTAAFAQGTMMLDTCIPNCVAGAGHSFPALVALWRTEPRPGHAGERYFTRLTLIYTGNRTYSAGGKQYSLPPTATYPLTPDGGA
jgi:hypothetical protein